MTVPRLFLVGSGVGKDQRGFEIHLLDLFGKLNAENRFETFLIKAAGKKTFNEIPLFPMSRKSNASRRIGRLLNRNSNYVQYLSFFVRLIPVLFRYKPTALYLGEPIIFDYLYRWRAISGMRYRLVFFSGGNTVPGKIGPGDFLQLVTPELTARAVELGWRPGQMKVIPHFIDEPDGMKGPFVSKARYKEALGLPEDRLLILSVGALDRSVKRMDYLIREVSRLVVPYFLILLGEEEQETKSIRELAEQRLGRMNFQIQTVSRNALTGYYRAADLFVLCSLQEGFGLVTAEALLQGLPVLVHDHPVARYVLDQWGTYSDFTQENNLTRLIEASLPRLNDPEAAAHRRNSILDRFSWDHLASEYRDMFDKALEQLPDQPRSG